MSEPTPDKDEHLHGGTIPSTPPSKKGPVPEMPVLPETPEPIFEWWDMLPDLGRRKRRIRPVQLVPLPRGEPPVSDAPDQQRYSQVSSMDQMQEFLDSRLEHLALLETLHLPTMNVTAVPGEYTQKRRVIASTAGGAAIAGIGDMLSALLRYVTNVAMTHMVAPGIYGVFVETNTVVTVLGYASKLGMDSASLRFLSTYRAKGMRGHMTGLLRFAPLLALVSGLICALLFWGLAWPLAHTIYHRAIYTQPFQEAAALIPLIGMQLVIASSLQALKAIKWKIYVDRLIQPGITLLLLAVFYFLGLRLEALILATICGFLASTVTGQLLLRVAAKRLSGDTQGVKAAPCYESRIWLRFAFPMFFNSMVRNILNSTDVLFLGAVATAGQVGLYGAADRVSYFVVAPLVALNVIFSPVIAEFHARHQFSQLTSMFKVVTRWSFSLSWPMFLCCTLFHDAILAIFGEKYIAAGVVLVILALGNLVDAGVGSVNYLLVMTGHPKIILTNTVTTVVVNVTLALLLVPRFNILGAAISAASTVILLNFVGLIEVYWIMKIHPYSLDILKPLLAGGGAWLASFVLMQITPAEAASPVGVLALMVLFLVVYIALLVVMRFSEEDMMVFNTLRVRLGKPKL